MENHLVDPTEKAENAESSENITDDRYQQYNIPNNRLTIIGPTMRCQHTTRRKAAVGTAAAEWAAQVRKFQRWG